MGEPTVFIDDAAVTAREAEVPAANFDNGMNLGGQEGTLPDGAVRFGDNPTAAEKAADPALDGTITPVGNCTLNTLAAGWVTNA
jgi:hypothetical protein